MGILKESISNWREGENTGNWHGIDGAHVFNFNGIGFSPKPTSLPPSTPHHNPRHFQYEMNSFFPPLKVEMGTYFLVFVKKFGELSLGRRSLS